ncbi:4-coumarate CoA ligase, partial [Trifolium pratense]
ASKAKLIITQACYYHKVKEILLSLDNKKNKLVLIDSLPPSTTTSSDDDDDDDHVHFSTLIDAGDEKEELPPEDVKINPDDVVA